MPPGSTPSLRELARTLGLSHTTVSEALRNLPRVKEETRQRVLAAAGKSGYKYNPLAGALMSEMRRSRAGRFRGVIAIIDMDGAESRPANAAPYHEGLARGARERAEELGFKTEVFSVGNRGISSARLNNILQSRGIHGVYLLPVKDAPDLSRLDWAHYAGVYGDYIIERPALYSVCSDHYRSIYFALQRLHALGYRRPGLVLHKHNDERLLHRWECGFHAYRDHQGEFERIEPLLIPEVTRESFMAWFKKKKPDVVLCHRAEAIGWMEECGASVPKTHGFCCLNVTVNTLPCAGLDLQPALLGARAVELVIAQLHRNEFGVPAIPSTTEIAARWTEGPTLRAPATERAHPHLV
jgi:DNA-binding LacI/PurR family transcriptional regulator